MDGVPFREGIAPFVRIERRLPRSVLVAAANPAALGIVELAVILRLPRVFLGIGRLAQRLRHLRDREIGGGIFQRTRGIPIDADIVRHVAELVVIFDALAPDRADPAALRSEERRVGNEWLSPLSSGGSPVL